MKKRVLSILGVLALLSITSCGGSPSSETPKTEEPVVEDNSVSVYIMSGQSNMEGSTFYDHGGKPFLRNAMEELDLDADPCFDGIEEVVTSYYGYYPYGGGKPTPHASNKEEPIQGEFLPTKVGMGNKDEYMGPEIGLAYTLKEHIQGDKKIYLIKCAFSGSGFASQNPNWTTRNNKDDLYNEFITFVHNNLQLIEDEGYSPVIKGFLWHQGESDANEAYQAEAYSTKMRTLINDVREEFTFYAPEENGENIAFIDALIYDGNRITYGAVDKLNDVKESIAEDSDMNFCINTSTKREGGLGLQIGGNSNLDGCDGMYHYTTKDCFLLGQAYANVIIENELL